MIMLKDSIIKEIIQFLQHCESEWDGCPAIYQYYSVFIFFIFKDYGRNIPTMVEQPLQQDSLHGGRNTVTYEARLLKALFLRLV